MQLRGLACLLLGCLVSRVDRWDPWVREGLGRFQLDQWVQEAEDEEGLVEAAGGDSNTLKRPVGLTQDGACELSQN